MDYSLKVKAKQILSPLKWEIFFISLIFFLLLAVLTLSPYVIELLSSKHEMSEILKKVLAFSVTVAVSVFFLMMFSAVSICFYKNDWQKKVGFFRCFTFGSFIRLLKIKSFLFLAKSLILIVSFLPVLLPLSCLVILYENRCPKEAVGIMALCLLVCVFLFIKMNFEFSRMLFLADYFYLSDKDETVLGAFSKSIIKTKGETGKLKRLKTSFLFQFILCLFILPIPFVYIYYKCTLAQKALSLTR